jgi:ABC-type sulfate transport system permease subunit
LCCPVVFFVGANVSEETATFTFTVEIIYLKMEAAGSFEYSYVSARLHGLTFHNSLKVSKV